MSLCKLRFPFFFCIIDFCSYSKNSHCFKTCSEPKWE